MSSNAPASSHKGASPIAFVAVGLLALIFWAYVSLLQIQTSEAFVLGGSTTGLVPNFNVLHQIPDFVQGHLDATMVKAVIWGWGVEILFLIAIVGYDHAHGSVKSNNQTLGTIFSTGIWLIILYNFVSDFKYGQIGTGFWGQFGFAMIATFVVAFLGVIGIRFLEVAVKDMKR